MRGSGQYVFDDQGIRFLDCAGSVAHLGHSHPRVLQAFQDSHLHTTLHWDGRAIDGRSAGREDQLKARLQPLLPACLSEVVLLHSGSQANGLAIQLARAVTGGSDVVVFENSFHGSLSETSACSTVLGETLEPWVGTTLSLHACNKMSSAGSAAAVWYKGW